MSVSPPSYLVTTPSSILFTLTPPTFSSNIHSLVKITSPKPRSSSLTIESQADFKGKSYIFNHSLDPSVLSSAFETLSNSCLSPTSIIKPTDSSFPTDISTTDLNFMHFNISLAATYSYLHFFASSSFIFDFPLSPLSDYINQPFLSVVADISNIYLNIVDDTLSKNWLLQIIDFHQSWNHLLPSSTTLNIPDIRSRLLTRALSVMSSKISPKSLPILESSLNVPEQTQYSLFQIQKLAREVQDELYTYTEQLSSFLTDNIQNTSEKASNQFSEMVLSLKDKAVKDILAHVENYFNTNSQQLFDDITLQIRRNLLNSLTPLVTQHVNHFNSHTEVMRSSMMSSFNAIQHEIQQIKSLNTNLDIIDQKLSTLDQKFQSTTIMANIKDLQISIAGLEDKISILNSTLGL